MPHQYFEAWRYSWRIFQEEEGRRREESIHYECDTLNVRERPQPTEQHEEVEVFEGKKIKVGKNLTEAVRHGILAIIVEFHDIFAFSIEEMFKISPNIMCHKLDIKPGYKLVKQKLRHQRREIIEAAKEEVNKFLKAGFIREC